ncbi:hypothetical protein OSB04_032203 [Centaurea solstitialis]|uniref:Uncharacterized protein n=1 Tax=Centaurea solstitialis TaxID=347529 RepID=A0AA38SNM7_9ASTR|nr:hypothetical protein OSB04_032203 [Centaurea solstitialis]
MRVLARLALLQNSGDKMLLRGRETMNNRKDSNYARGHFLQQGQNGNLTCEGRAQICSARAWTHRVEPCNVLGRAGSLIMAWARAHRVEPCNV